MPGHRNHGGPSGSGQSNGGIRSRYDYSSFRDHGASIDDAGGGRYRKGVKSSLKRSGSLRSVKRWMTKLVQKPSSGTASYDVRPTPAVPKAVSDVGISDWRPPPPPHADTDSGLDTPSEGRSLSAAQVACLGVRVGLENLGNSCYQSAVFQALAHSDRLAQYLALGQFRQHLLAQDERQVRNSAKHGTDGVLTAALADFIRALWTGTYSGAMSRTISDLMGRWSRDYGGGGQQDAQEFLLWLLDKVHEDLNMPSAASPLKAKAKASGYASEEELAGEELSRHRSVHCSFLTYLFEAQFRSIVSCPSCGASKLNYEPYMCVSLPVPQDTRRPLFLTMAFHNRVPRLLELGLNAELTATLAELKKCLAKEASIPFPQLVIVESTPLCAMRLLDDGGEVGSLGVKGERTLYGMEMPLASAAALPALLLCTTPHHSAGHKRFGAPYALILERDWSFSEIKQAVMRTIKPSLSSSAGLEDISERYFKLRIMDDFSVDVCLASGVPLPLYTQEMEAIIGRLKEVNRGSGSIRPLRILVEWSPEAVKTLLSRTAEELFSHGSAADLRRELAETRPSALADALAAYTKTEFLDWRCRRCRKWTANAEKRLDFWSLPDLLILHFKRFRYTVEGECVKLDPLVEFPLEGLDLGGLLPNSAAVATPQLRRRDGTTTVPSNGTRNGFARNGKGDGTRLGVDTESGRHVYDLYAVVYHHGDSLHSGHYTAAVRSPLDERWRSFDDTKVTDLAHPPRPDQLVNKDAYLLFYERRQSNGGRSPESGQGHDHHWSHQLSSSFVPQPKLYAKKVEAAATSMPRGSKAVRSQAAGPPSVALLPPISKNQTQAKSQPSPEAPEPRSRRTSTSEMGPPPTTLVTTTTTRMPPKEKSVSFDKEPRRSSQRHSKPSPATVAKATDAFPRHRSQPPIPKARPSLAKRQQNSEQSPAPPTRPNPDPLPPSASAPVVRMREPPIISRDSPARHSYSAKIPTCSAIETDL